jgi:hypothetical protein
LRDFIAAHHVLPRDDLARFGINVLPACCPFSG